MSQTKLKRFIPSSRLSKLRALHKKNPVKAVILAGKAVLENAGWCRGKLAKTASHKEIQNSEYLDSESLAAAAGSFCSIGALERGAYELTGTINYGAADSIIERANGFYDLADWNDDNAKSKNAVIKAFDKGAQSL